MTADRLREAATRLREVAEAATPGPWMVDDRYGDEDEQWYHGHGITADGREDVYVTDCLRQGSNGSEDADYIATMAPPVALAMADWLDATAERIDFGRSHRDGGRSNHGWRGTAHALALADAILGTDA